MKETARDRGAAAVEFALVLPVFVVLILGILEIAVIGQAKVSLDTAVRAGVRELALTGSEDAAKAAMERHVPALGTDAADVTLLGCEVPDPDSPTILTAPDGGEVTVHADGATTVHYADGSEMTISSDGSTRAVATNVEGDPEVTTTEPTRAPLAPAPPVSTGNATVEVTYARPLLTGLLGLSMDLDSQGVMRCGG